MTMPRSQLPLLPSLFDRLIDEETDRDPDAAPSAATVLQDVRRAIRRDLEHLLNTRRVVSVPVKRYPELSKSVVGYGLPDFSSVQLSAAEDRERLRAAIEDTIRRYETRFRHVTVELADDQDYGDRTLRLRITALLMLEPDPVSLVFDSRIHPADRKVRLAELSHG